MQPDGRIIATTTTAIVRMLANGTSDSTFSSPFRSRESVSFFALLPGGKILVRGGFVDGNNSLAVIRLNTDGTRDSAFRAPLVADFFGHFAADASGRFYSGTSTMVPPVLRFTPDGDVDETFRATQTIYAGDIFAPLADGSLLSASSAPRGSTSSLSARGPRLARFLADGVIDSAFLPERAALPLSGVFAIVPLPDGRAFILGGDGEPTSTTRFLRLLRVTPAGVLDFAYHTRFLHNTIPVDGVEFVIAGVLLDLLRDAGATSPVTLDATLFPFSPEPSRVRMSLHPDGQLLLQSSSFPFARYVRTTAPGPSFDPKPSILQESVITNLPTILGATQVMSVQAGGLLPLTYQWQLNGVPIPGATATTFTRSNSQLTHTGDYTLVATNPHGAVTSRPIHLTVDGARTVPVFTTRPTPQSVAAGGTATFSAFATSVPTATYQWRRNDVLIPGATSAALTLTNVQPSQAGLYSVTATIPGFTASGPSATLTVTNPVSAYYQGFALSRAPGSALSGDFVFVTKADRTATLLISLVDPSIGRKILVATSLQLMPDGKFFGTAVETNQRTATYTAHSITGSVTTEGRVTGASAELSLAFSGNSLGADAGPHGGYYHARMIAADNADVHLVVAPGDRIFAFVQAPLVAEHGADFVVPQGSRANVLMMLASGFALTASLEADTGKVSGNIERLLAPDRAAVIPGPPFAGLRDDIPSVTHLANLATRGRVGLGAEGLIAGFVIAGSASRDVLVRGVGPTLGDFGVTGALFDPTLVVSGTNLPGAYSENWGSEISADNLVFTTARVGAFALPRTSRDAAASALLLPGAYSAQIGIARGSPGVALVEVYDSSVQAYTTTSSRLANLSTRGRVGTDAETLIAGFVLVGNGPQRLLIRGIGPALAAFGINDVLADPVLNISDSTGLLIGNDDWSSASPNRLEVEAVAASVGAFPLSAGSRDAALVVTLLPGSYSAQISGKAGGSGLALVEIYVVP